MLRIWSEHLQLADARRADVVDLLTSGPVHPFFAVTPEADLDELAHTLRVLTDAGLEPGAQQLSCKPAALRAQARSPPPHWSRKLRLSEKCQTLSAHGRVVG